MVDLETMINSIPLSECEKEIVKQFASIADHENRMKRVVLLCFFGEIVMNELAKEDLDKFIEGLSKYINKIITGNNTEKIKQLKVHIKENNEIFNNIDAASGELKDISSKVESLMADYDRQLAEIIESRDKLPISKL